jgi:hypothetical protein
VTGGLAQFCTDFRGFPAQIVEPFHQRVDLIDVVSSHPPRPCAIDSPESRLRLRYAARRRSCEEGRAVLRRSSVRRSNRWAVRMRFRSATTSSRNRASSSITSPAGSGSLRHITTTLQEWRHSLKAQPCGPPQRPSRGRRGLGVPASRVHRERERTAFQKPTKQGSQNAEETTAAHDAPAV